MSIKLILATLIILICFPAFAGLKLDGTDDHIDLGSIGKTIGSTAATMSFSFWLKTTETTNKMIYGAVQAGGGNMIQVRINLNSSEANNDGSLFFLWQDNGGLDYADAVDSDTGITDGNWHHLFYTGDFPNNNIELFVDGVLQTDTNDIDENPTDESDLQENPFLGGFNNFGTLLLPLPGSLSDFAIWTNKLGQTEATLLYSFGKRMALQVSPSTLFAYYSLDDLSAGSNLASATFVDFSGNGRNGTGSDADASGGQAISEQILSYP